MSELAIKIYDYFKSHKGVMYALLTLTTLFFLFFTLKLNFEEDISKLLPSNEIGSNQELVFDNLKVKDKIFLVFVPKNEEVGYERLGEACTEFSDSLLAHDSEGRISDLLYGIDEELMLEGVDYLYSNLPIFLEEGDYAAMDSAFTPDRLEEQMQANYEALLDPSGMFAYDMVRKDPAGLRKSYASKAGALAESLGGSYKIIGGSFFTPDSTCALAFLTPSFKSFDSKAGIRLTEQIESEIAAFSELYPDVEVLFHGAPIQSVFNSRQIKKDLLLTLGISLLLVCGFLAYSYKNTSTIPLMLLPVCYGALFALCCIYFMFGSMSLLAMGLGAIVLGVALSYCLHIITHYKYVTDPVRVLREETVPVMLGSITTVGAFMGLLFTDSALLRDFGLFASLAIVGTTLCCIIFLPQFLNARDNKRSQKVFAAFNKISSYPLHNKKWLVGLLSIVCVVCIYFSNKVEFDTDLVNIGYTEPSVARSQKLVADKTAGGNATLYFASISADRDSAYEHNRQFAERLKEAKAGGLIEGYSNTSALLLPRAEQEDRIERWNEYWTDARKAEVRRNVLRAGAKYGLEAEFFEPFFELIGKDYEPSDLYASGLLPGGLQSNFIEYTDSTYMVFAPVKVTSEKRREACDYLLSGHGEQVVIDPFYYTSDMVKILTDNYNVILQISSLFVFAVLLLSFRSLTLALLAFFPMFISWYVVIGAMAIFGIKFNLISIIVSSFIFGVGVDYSIFIMQGLIAGDKNKDMLLYHKTAVFLSAVILVMTISSLMFATHPAISSIGLVVLIGMVTTLLLTFTLQPFAFNFMMRFAFFRKIVSKRQARTVK